jgi:CRISP-associated protein Cas1
VKPPRTLQQLLGIEGAIPGDYFRVWAGLPIKWKSLKRFPVPSEWSAYKSRVALRADAGVSNRGATHPVNAMLNYAYGVLAARVQGRLIMERYDPMLGILHDNAALRGTYPALALDYMEPIRPVVDRAILQLIKTVTFTGSDFPIQHDGVCRLNPELARRVAQFVLERCEIGCRLS